MITVAFDIDDTLWKIRRLTPNCSENCKKGEYCKVHKPKLDQVPDYDLVQVLRWFLIMEIRFIFGVLEELIIARL